MTINNNVNNVNVSNYLNNNIPSNQKIENTEFEKIKNNTNSDKNEIKINGKKDVPIINIVDKTDNKSIKEYKKEIFDIIGKKSHLELKDKEKIIDIFKEAENNGKFNDLVIDLHKNKQLKSIHKLLGTLINQGEAGAMTSVFLGIFTLGMSSISEAKMNRAYDLENMMIKNNIPKEIIDNLK